MKKLYYIFLVFFLIFFLFSCKEKKIQTATEQLIGTWIGDIQNGQWCDTNDYDKVILELKDEGIALLNYSGPNGNRWTTPYECKWWLEIKKTYNPLSESFMPPKDNYFFLYITRFDTLGFPCKDYFLEYECIFPDTTSYQLVNFNENYIKTALNKIKRCIYSDLLISDDVELSGLLGKYVVNVKNLNKQ